MSPAISQDQFQVRPSDIHLIGHSLGAQTSGYAGERIPGLGRITGEDVLDQLAPLNGSLFHGRLVHRPRGR